RTLAGASQAREPASVQPCAIDAERHPCHNLGAMGLRGARRGQAARYALGAASILALGTHSSHALAQSANDQASRLFEDARRLMSEGRFADACPLLAQSDLLDPAVGTKMNLAKCYESLGRTASAWRVWGEAINALTLQHRTAADEAE